MLPLTLTAVAAIWFARKLGQNRSGREYARSALLLSAWLYSGLNYDFFHFPWPWEKWTGRTPNALAFTVCVLGLTFACLSLGRRGQPAGQDGYDPA